MMMEGGGCGGKDVDGKEEAQGRAGPHAADAGAKRRRNRAGDTARSPAREAGEEWTDSTVSSLSSPRSGLSGASRVAGGRSSLPVVLALATVARVEGSEPSSAVPAREAGEEWTESTMAFVPEGRGLAGGGG